MRRNLVDVQEMYVRVGEAIRSLRLTEGDSVNALATRIGVTKNHLQKIESGETACALHVLVKIADEYDTTLDALVPVAIEERELVA